MNPRSPFTRLAAVAFAACAISACSKQGDDAPASDAATEATPDGAQSRGSYDIDEETGETRARFTDDQGRTTTMRSGEKVPVRLPAGFTVYPGAKIAHNTRVEQADGLLVLLNLETDADLDKVVAYYRNQAEALGIDVATSLQTGPMTMIGGQNQSGTSFSLTATRDEKITRAQLSIGQGLK